MLENGWLVCVVWVFTLFISHSIGYNQGYKTGEVGERFKWLKNGWKDDAHDKKD